LPPSRAGDGPDLDLRPPVRLDLWAVLFAAGIALGTVAPPLAPVLVAASLIVAVATLSWRNLMPSEWLLMAVLGPVFAAAGVAVALLHAATQDPLAELAAVEPGEVMMVGRIASPPERSGFGYMADFRVDHLWYHGEEILRGGGVEVFAGDLSVDVGDRVMVEGEISLPRVGEDGFDYGRYLCTNSESLRDTASPESLRDTASPKTPLTSRLLSGRTNTSSRSIL
jgi:competence protein ComEC